MEYVRECNYKRIGNGKETKNLKEFCICFYSLVSKISFHVKNIEIINLHSFPKVFNVLCFGNKIIITTNLNRLEDKQVCKQRTQ